MAGQDGPTSSTQDSLEPSNVSEAVRSNASIVTPIEAISRLRATTLGWGTQDEVRTIWAHAEHCLACWSLLTRDDEIRRRLALLRETEPRFDVLERVMRRIDEGA